MFMIVSIQIAAIAKDYWLNREIQRVQALIEVEESENVRLSSTLNGITSIAAIETYATEVLGMTKAESYQIECIDLSVGDAVRVKIKTLDVAKKRIGLTMKNL
jgi:hypothetical protein